MDKDRFGYIKPFCCPYIGTNIIYHTGRCLLSIATAALKASKAYSDAEGLAPRLQLPHLNSLGIYPPLKHSNRVAKSKANPHAQAFHNYWRQKRRQREGVFKIWFFLSAFFTDRGHQYERSE